ncbi:hypothetical protein UK23_30965 [Lentzea aerocolonigenes]|uniref:DUF4328 domain-containing protein n=1 Tax=Lentzea aerocolonigenes TaxID=68170 RepID=A0A0F0GN79_LENAE|nr:hypothetical protein UK23_30965 [Lentzea aerocolonigenes]
MRGLGRAASALIWLVAIANVANAASDWFTYSAIQAYRTRIDSAGAIITAERINLVASASLSLLLLAAGIVFILWTYNARVNAERLTYAAEHRRSRTWVWLSWFVPFVNFWFPKQVIDDIWRASDPRQQGVPLRQRMQHRLTTQWWTAFVLMWIFERAYLRTYRLGVPISDTFLSTAIFSSLAAAAGIVAAISAVQVVRRITEFQSTPHLVQSSSD